MRRRIWLLAVAAFVPFGVCLYDMGQNPVQATPAILSLLSGCVLLLAASLLTVFPAEDGQETVTALVATTCLFMTARAVVMQSVPTTAVTVVVAGFLFLLFMKAQPRVKERK